MAESVDANLSQILEGKAPSTVAIFDRSDHFCCYGEDSLFVAKVIFKSNTMLKSISSGGAQLSYITLNQNQYCRVVRELLLGLQYRIELYETSSSYKNATSVWEITKKASPGNVDDFEDILSDSVDGLSSSGVIAIKLTPETGDPSKVDVSVAFCDPQNYSFIVAEFCDASHLTNLEALLVYLSPRECIICAGLNDSSLQAILTRSKILKTEQKKEAFSSSSIIQDLDRLLKFEKGTIPNSAQLSEVSLRESMHCLSAIIRYLGLLNESAYCGRYSLSTFTFGHFLRLDSSALEALQLFSSSDGRTEGSLYSLLNKCKTHAGRKLLAQWIRQPLTDINKIAERCDIVERICEDTVARSMLYQDMLNRIPDLYRLEKRLARGKASLQDLYKLYQVLKLIPKLLEYINSMITPESSSSITDLLIEPLEDARKNFVKYLGMIESTLDLEAICTKSEYRVNPAVDPKLTELKDEMNILENQMDKVLQEVASNLGLAAGKGIKIVTTGEMGPCFRITKKDEKLLRDNAKKYSVIDSARGGVRFTTSNLSKLNEKFVTLNCDYAEAQKAIVQSIIEVAVGYCDPLRRLTVTLASIDVLVSLAVSAVSAPIRYVRPTLHEKGTGVLKLNKCRHPCLEDQEGISFIPNDLHMTKGKSDTLILTGPNMGGKSTYLRQCAINILLAQMGSLVACSEADVSIVDAIFTRVGACDNESKGISTFMAEMLDSAVILQGATQNSFVIVDELGRGTSTYDGFGLAWAIAEHMAKEIGCFLLFATHFHEMTSLSDDLANVVNAHVSAYQHENKLTLLYQVEPGPCDKSFGLHVAEMVKFPAHVIQFTYAIGVYSGIYFAQNFEIQKVPKPEDFLQAAQDWLDKHKKDQD